MAKVRELLAHVLIEPVEVKRLVTLTLRRIAVEPSILGNGGTYLRHALESYPGGYS